MKIKLVRAKFQQKTKVQMKSFSRFIPTTCQKICLNGINYGNTTGAGAAQGITSKSFTPWSAKQEQIVQTEMAIKGNEETQSHKDRKGERHKESRRERGKKRKKRKSEREQ
jgi:hypothetical protein